MEGDFEVVQGGPLCTKLLADIRKRCSRLPELETLCAHEVGRLESLRTEVASREPNDPLRVRYVQTLGLLVKATHQRPLLERLAKCDTVAQIFRHLQQDIDLVADGLGRGDCDEMNKWQLEWERDRAQQFSVLAEQVANSTDRGLMEDIHTEKKLEEILADLKTELRRDNLPQDQLELKKEVPSY
ncbi:serine/threonine protein kinase [Phytophthora cinnamomi]|uniref:serine/threonine protein kinase n=1 Tax=Phytophthora cinnamomi TaxID=4785 RepID=UPI0035597155|nr:serine/threonine protein kinase [Phytophthora cinnamomi]